MNLDQVDGRPRANPVPAECARHKELAHVEIKRPPAMRCLVQQRKPRQRAARPDEPHRAIQLAPVTESVAFAVEPRRQLVDRADPLRWRTRVSQPRPREGRRAALRARTRTPASSPGSCTPPHRYVWRRSFSPDSPARPPHRGDASREPARSDESSPTIPSHRRWRRGREIHGFRSPSKNHGASAIRWSGTSMLPEAPPKLFDTPSPAVGDRHS